MAIINGTAGNDTLTGTKDADSIFGLSGSDTINATQGADTVDGGTGNDRLTIVMGDVARFDSFAGPRTYTVTATLVTDGAGLLNTSMTSVERITLNTTGTGDYDDVINASGFTSAASFPLNITTGNGSDTITGSAIADSIIAGRGNNWVDAGGGADTVRFYFDNSLGGTIIVTGSTGNITASANGISSTALNAEDVYIMGDNLTTGTTIDASSVTGDVRLAFINSMSGSDVFIGHNGIDVFGTNYQATAGGDTYTGNGGADILDYVASVLAMNGDVITDFDGDDMIDLSFNDSVINGGGALADKFIGGAAFSGTAGEYRFQISGATTLLQVDTNGDGLADQTLTIANGTFALAETSEGSNQLKLAASVIGTDDSETLSGTSTSETIRGLAGNDVIIGNGGDDVIDGGDGTDTASYANANGGVDIDLGAAYFDGADGRDTLIRIENLIGSSFSDGLGGDAGSNVIDGGGGNDFIDGGSGGDTLYGGDGNDTLQGDYGDNNTTATGDDFIYGGNGRDQLRGGLGADQLFGGANNDLMRGNDGVDYFDGGSDDGFVSNDLGDRVSFYEARATQGAVADLRTGTISNDGYGNVETMVGIESLGGDTAFVDTFHGNDDPNFLTGSRGDFLYGHGGNDFFQMLSAAAVLDGGDGIDVLNLFVAPNGWLIPDTNGDGFAELAAAATSGWSVDLSKGSTVDGYGNVGTIAGIENVGSTHLDDMLVGDASANVFEGRAGNDILDGGLGNDVLDGGDGKDTASYASASGAVRVTLQNDGTGGSTGAAGTDSLVSIEDVVGSAFNDVITGNSLANALDGSDGDDILRGAGGNDQLTGGAGYDRMYGGTGDDTYIVNDVDDYAYELAGEGQDSVISSIDHQLRAEVEDLTLTGAAAIGKGNASDNVILGNGAANKLYGYGGVTNCLAVAATITCSAARATIR
ncbi:hypothetical protein H9L12_09110 [Sphingomonas rhizophila]|uniref:Calcium-binding protein n=1 Tax=Sphingomonas rhizophila TaxID=2071607 RepID=A0A7G9S9F1_9SPHN|nr:calcium-binding protein [Sphingomonas rhizophila]QNN64476.1 hypothetical protein H9L12_09110 [Sphingomonas rhizophila]